MPHLLFTQVLDDTKPDERKMGIQAGMAFLQTIPTLVVYEDLGISSGMQAEIAMAKGIGIRLEFRRIRP